MILEDDASGGYFLDYDGKSGALRCMCIREESEREEDDSSGGCPLGYFGKEREGGRESDSGR